MVKGFDKCYSCVFYTKEKHNSGYCEKKNIHNWGGNQKSCGLYQRGHSCLSCIYKLFVNKNNIICECEVSRHFGKNVTEKNKCKYYSYLDQSKNYI